MENGDLGQVKTLVESKTFWGAVVSLAGSALALTHYTMSPADAAQAVDLLAGIAGTVGSGIAIYGRIVASKKIGSLS